jgi:hypothetical protein
VRVCVGWGGFWDFQKTHFLLSEGSFIWDPEVRIFVKMGVEYFEMT